MLVGCSGGADSLALAAAAAFELPRRGVRVGAVVIDHGLQGGSDRVAVAAAQTCRDLGLDPIDVVRVQVSADGGDGPEAAARTARRAAFDTAVRDSGATHLLLGHTRDDQAETVLLRLARGSGTRAIAGMAAVTTMDHGLLVRPFLREVGRAQTRAACQAQGITWWDDPHNDDPRYTRVRVRRALRELREDLGPGLVEGLVRTAALARQDADHLDGLARDIVGRLGAGPWAVNDLQPLPVALRSRVWRLLTAGAGAMASDVGAGHVASLDALLTDWHGQGPVDLPGGLQVSRRDGLVAVAPRPVQ